MFKKISLIQSGNCGYIIGVVNCDEYGNCTDLIQDENNISKEDLEMVDKCHCEDCCDNCDDTNELPYRLEEWFNFDEAVCKHIEDYTIPQYGDYPQDLLTTTTNECIIHDMKRYLNRFGKGQRGYEEAMRDMLKVAQYAGVLYNRLQNQTDVSARPDKFGTPYAG